MGRCSGIRAVRIGLVLAACSLGGAACHLLDSYSVGNRPGSDTGSASPDGDTLGGLDTASPSDTESPSDTASASDGDAARQDTADGEAGVPQEPCPDESGVYCVRRAAPSSVRIDGTCSAEEFGEGDETRMPIKAPGDDQPPGKNSTNNVIDCHARWFSSGQPQIHICCEVEDSDRVYSAEFGDPVGKIWGKDPYDPDDRFEFGRRGDQMRQRDGGRKLFVNIREGRPVHFDSVWGDSSDSSGTLAAFEGTSKWKTGGYVVEWKVPLGVSVEAGDAALCNFMHQDVDDVDGSATRRGTALLWGQNSAINKPDVWETCFYQ